jgi:hypothetical protein
MSTLETDGQQQLLDVKQFKNRSKTPILASKDAKHLNQALG